MSIFDKCQHPDYELKDITTTGGTVSDIFDKYGDYYVVLRDNTHSIISFEEFTLNELADALEEKLYPRFKERYDREKDNVDKG